MSEPKTIKEALSVWPEHLCTICGRPIIPKMVRRVVKGGHAQYRLQYKGQFLHRKVCGTRCAKERSRRASADYAAKARAKTPKRKKSKMVPRIARQKARVVTTPRPEAQVIVPPNFKEAMVATYRHHGPEWKEALDAALLEYKT